MADFPANLAITFGGEQYDVQISGNLGEFNSLVNTGSVVPESPLQYALYLMDSVPGPSNSSPFPIYSINVYDSTGALVPASSQFTADLLLWAYSYVTGSSLQTLGLTSEAQSTYQTASAVYAQQSPWLTAFSYATVALNVAELAGSIASGLSDVAGSQTDAGAIVNFLNILTDSFFAGSGLTQQQESAFQSAFGIPSGTVTGAELLQQLETLVTSPNTTSTQLQHSIATLYSELNNGATLSESAQAVAANVLTNLFQAAPDQTFTGLAAFADAWGGLSSLGVSSDVALSAAGGAVGAALLSAAPLALASVAVASLYQQLGVEAQLGQQMHIISELLGTVVQYSSTNWSSLELSQALPEFYAQAYADTIAANWNQDASAFLQLPLNSLISFLEGALGGTSAQQAILQFMSADTSLLGQVGQLTTYLQDAQALATTLGPSLPPAPILEHAGNTATYVPSGAATAVAPTLLVSDAGEPDAIGALVFIKSGLLGGDTLNFVNQLGIVGNYDASAGMLLLSGSASIADYQTALDSITYSSSNPDPSAGGTDSSRTISWMLSDAEATSAPVTSTIDVQPALSSALKITTEPSGGSFTESGTVLVGGSTINWTGTVQASVATSSGTFTALAGTMAEEGSYLATGGVNANPPPSNFTNPNLLALGAPFGDAGLAIWGNPSANPGDGPANETISYSFSSPLHAGTSFVLLDPGAYYYGYDGPYTYTVSGTLGGTPVATSGWTFQVVSQLDGVTPSDTINVNPTTGQIVLSDVPGSGTQPGPIIIVTTDTAIDSVQVTASTIPYDFWGLVLPESNPGAPLTVASVSASGPSGDLIAGNPLTITLALTEPVMVVGAPTLQLNDSEVATYSGGSGTNALNFTYVVQPGDHTPDLQVTGLDLANGANIQNAVGNNLYSTVISDLGLQVDTTNVTNGTATPPTLVAPVANTTVEGAGYDVLNMSQNPIATGSSGYTMTTNQNGTFSLATANSSDLVTGVMQVEFSDKTVTVAANNSGNEYIALLYQGALGRTPDPTGLAYWEQIGKALPVSTQALGVYGLSDASGNYNGGLSIAGGFTNSAEFITKYGSLTNAQFVTQLYSNVLDRAPDSDGFNYWTSQLTSGVSREHVLVGFADSAEAIANATNGYTGQSGTHAAWLFLT